MRVLMQAIVIERGVNIRIHVITLFLSLLFTGISSSAQDREAAFEVKLKMGVSELETSIATSFLSSTAYPGRTYFFHDQLEADQPGLFMLAEVERSINRWQIGFGLGYAQNGFSYIDGYVPVGLAADSLPNALEVQLDYRLLINTIKVGYRIGNRLSVTPYIGLYNTRLDGINFVAEVWDQNVNNIIVTKGTTKDRALLVWDNALALEIASMYAISERLALGVSLVRSQTLGDATPSSGAQGVGIGRFLTTRYQRQAVTFSCSFRL